jgi:catechol 2,3-dioxygenase-like lactoylglutathione lyase family enzyme
MGAKAAAIGIVVADLSVSIAFYEHLGLSFTGADSPDGHAEAELAPGLRLMLDTEASIQGFTAGWTRPFGSPRTMIAFEFATPAEVDAMFTELMDAGYHGLRGPWDAPWGQRYASVIDPDGSGVDLFARSV